MLDEPLPSMPGDDRVLVRIIDEVRVVVLVHLGGFKPEVHGEHVELLALCGLLVADVFGPAATHLFGDTLHDTPLSDPWGVIGREDVV